MNKQKNNVNESIVLENAQWTKINKGMLYKMHSIVFKEIVWTIHKLYQRKQMDLPINCVIQNAHTIWNCPFVSFFGSTKNDRWIVKFYSKYP
jgi:hypothetical protein